MSVNHQHNRCQLLYRPVIQHDPPLVRYCKGGAVCCCSQSTLCCRCSR
jgi:hypothetical protein